MCRQLFLLSENVLKHISGVCEERKYVGWVGVSLSCSDVENNKWQNLLPFNAFTLYFDFFLQLLAPDIRHERNVVLQCIRHIVKNDFFGATSNAATDSTSTVSSNSVNRPTGTPSDDMNHLEAAEKAESVSMETTSIETTDQAVPVSSETVERPELASAKDKQRVAESPTKDCLTDAEAASVESSTDPKTYSTDNSSPGRELNRTLSRDDEEIWENGVV